MPQLGLFIRLDLIAIVLLQALLLLFISAYIGTEVGTLTNSTQGQTYSKTDKVSVVLLISYYSYPHIFGPQKFLRTPKYSDMCEQFDLLAS